MGTLSGLSAAILKGLHHSANPFRIEYANPPSPDITGPRAQRIRHSHEPFLEGHGVAILRLTKTIKMTEVNYVTKACVNITLFT